MPRGDSSQTPSIRRDTRRTATESVIAGDDRFGRAGKLGFVVGPFGRVFDDTAVEERLGVHFEEIGDVADAMAARGHVHHLPGLDAVGGGD